MKKNKDVIMNAGLKAINDSFGYGMPGTHKKKCDICGGEFDEPNDLSILLINGPSKCVDCKYIIELKDILISHWEDFRKAESNSPIEERNMILDDEYSNSFIKTTTFSLDEFEQTYDIKGRTKKVKEVIERIDKARKFLYFSVEPQIKILESIYENKDIFWKNCGNLSYHVKNASFEFVVIKLNEMLTSNSKYSLNKFKNIIINEMKALFQEHQIVSVRTFKRSGDVQKTAYPQFPIEKYLKAIDIVTKDYADIIFALKYYRDNVFAHIGELKKVESINELTYRKLKRTFNSLKIIYDGLFYAIAPDKFANLIIDHNLWFNYLNQITKEYEKNIKKESEEFNKSTKKQIHSTPY